MPGDTPKACSTCGSPHYDAVYDACKLRRLVTGRLDPFHSRYEAAIATSFEAALAALDVEPTHHTDRMVTTYDILGLDAVRAAHRAEVERAVAERDALMSALRWTAMESGSAVIDNERDLWVQAESGRVDDEYYDGWRVYLGNKALPEVWEDFDQAYEAAIRARGVAKQRTGSEAPSASDEGAKS